MGSQIQTFFSAIAIFVAYFLTARWGLSLDAVSGFATLVWVPTGIALAYLLFAGARFWPVIAFAAFLVNWSSGAPFVVALAIGLGNSFEAWLGSQLIRKFCGGRRRLDRLSDVAVLVGPVAVMSTLVSASVGVLSLWIADVVSSERFLQTMFAWWLGDAMGAIVVAPLLFSWLDRAKVKLEKKKVIEAIALTATVLLACSFVFLGLLPSGFVMFPRFYLLFPILFWAALRFKQGGATAISFIVSACAIGAALSGVDLFQSHSLSENLFELQSFLAVFAITGLILSAVVSERESSETERSYFSEKEMAALRRLNAHYSVMKTLTQTRALPEAAPRILQAICENLSWDLGVLWVVDPKLDRVVPIQIWTSEGGLDQYKSFVDRTLACAFKKNEGIPGRVWSSASPLWIHDLELDKNFPRLPIARQLGIQSAFATPIRVGNKVLGIIEFFSAELREPDREMLQTLATLGGQVGQFLELQSALKDAQDAVDVRDEFLSIASHELKTPITSLRLQLQLLERSTQKEANFEKHFKSTLKQVDRLTLLVEELLDVSRIQAGKLALQIEDVDVSQLIEEVVLRSRPQIIASKCALDLQLEPGIRARLDKFRIEQVLVNLISNATKYAAGCAIAISSRAANQDIEIDVSDNGPGIDKDRLGRIFDRFERATASRSISGLGLGLYIAKQVVESHKGSIEVLSEVGKGTLFRVRLPLSPDAHVGQAAMSKGLTAR